MATAKWMRTVRSSSASIPLTLLKPEIGLQPISSFRQYAAENATSAAVNGVPSDQVTPCLSVQVMERRSAATPPFSTVGISAASAGTMVPLSS